MTTVKLFASTILGAVEEAHSELVGKGVVLTDGKAGTVQNVWLDELHRSANLDHRPLREVAHLNHQIRAGGLTAAAPLGTADLQVRLGAPNILAGVPTTTPIKRRGEPSGAPATGWNHRRRK